MRILLVNYEYPPVGGGAGVASQAIAKELIKLGHTVVVLTGRFEDLPELCEEEGVIVHRVSGLRRSRESSGIFEMALFLGVALMRVRAIIRKHRVEAAIIFFSFPCGPIGLLAKWKCDLPYVVSLRGGDVPSAEPRLKFLHRVLGPIRRAILKNSAAIVANSEGLRTMAETSDPFSVRVIPNGVDPDFFVPAEPSRSRNGNVLRILFVSRFQSQKNLPLLLEQVARLSPGTFELHLVGDGPQRNQLKRKATDLGIAHAITWHGWLTRSAVRDAYQLADCFVNPSLYEGMPNVVLEAMACGLPVVASDVPGNKDLVLHGQTGFLFNLKDSAALASALNQLRDADLRVRMGETARMRAIEFFSWRKTATQYADLLALALRVQK